LGIVCPFIGTVKSALLGATVGRKPGVQNIPKDAAQTAGTRTVIPRGYRSRCYEGCRYETMLPSANGLWQTQSLKTKRTKHAFQAKVSKRTLANLKDISFEDFSEQFLETKLFDHHKAWIDLVEGKAS
jgi:hypothetical protein